MNEQIFKLIIEQEDVTWKTLLYDLVKSEDMNPWNIDISLLTKRYIQLVKELQEHDLRVSGKVLLAAAILLKIKSVHLIENDISNLDRLFNQTDDELTEEELLEEIEESMHEKKERQTFQLIPRNPQPRNRKVSIHDLVDALQRAMESKKRILAKQRPVKYQMPKRKIDIVAAIYDLYHKISYYTNKNKVKKLSFTELLPARAGKQEKAYTFLPLLHLENQRKVETDQKEPFDEIYIKLLNKNGKPKIS